MRRLFPDPADIDGPAELEAVYAGPPEPHVRANFVTSLDGAVELGGRSAPLGGADDRAAFMAMRAVADVILVGAGTVRQEKYGPVRLEPDVVERRLGRGQSELPRLAIVSNRGELDPSAKVFSGPLPPLLLTTTAAADTHPSWRAGPTSWPWVTSGWSSASPSASCTTKVWCESCARAARPSFRSLIEADLLDELCLTWSDLLAGRGHHTLLGISP